MTATKTARTSTVSDADGVTPADAAEATRQPLARMAQNSATVLRAAEIIQQVNLQMLQRVALGQQQAADKLRQASSPPELMAVQSSLMAAGWTESMQYMQELMTASLKIQSELMSGAASSASAPAATGMTYPAAPIMQAWQSMFMAPLNGASTLNTH